ncbi:hypothetical protein [Actinoplanes sp. NPDC049599]|uniref:hypothetical protein n=1 Tax=Actinoplanes sp. NPDC049599 TaxID=3363903 RepID=UPI0037B6B95C
MLHTLEQQHTGPEHMSRRNTVASLLGGLAAIVWIAPLTLHDNLSESLFRVIVALTASLSVCAVLAGVELRVRSHLAWFRAEFDARDRRQHEELRQLVVNGHAAIRHQLNETVIQLGQRMDQVGVRTTQEYFNSYADAVTDVAGGPSVVDGTSTSRILRGQPADKVIPLPRHRPARSHIR